MVKINFKKSSKLEVIAAGNTPLCQQRIPGECSELHKYAPVWSEDQTDLDQSIEIAHF